MNDINDISPISGGGDPLIDEVRSIRRAISDQYGNDVDRLCDHLQELERQHEDWTVVSSPPETATSKIDR
jgi:hypothetical protein